MLSHHETRKYDGSTEIQLFRTKVPNQVADIAIDLVRRWGMVAAEPDGEDSAGRHQFKLMEPAQMVQRAIDTAEQIWKALDQAGHIVEVPAPQPPEEKD